MDLLKHHRKIATLLLLVFLFQQYGCTYWHRVDKPSSALPTLVPNRTMIYLVSHASGRETLWAIRQPILTNDSISGRLVKISDTTAERIMAANRGQEARAERNKLLLHVNEAIAVDSSSTGQRGVALSQVTRIESFDVEAGATIGMVVLSTIAVIGFIALLAALLKSSCPFIYSHASDGVHFEGEVFSGAIYPQLERHDRLPLRYLELVDGMYRITLANKAKEVQSTDLLKLITVDHAPGTIPLFDKYGTVHALSDPRPPVRAHDLNGTDVRDRLLLKDELPWSGDPMNQREEANDGLDLTFARPNNSATGKLVITARNTLWADHLYLLFLDEQGTMAPDIDSINVTRPAEELRAWSRDQRLPLAIWLEARPGEWQRMDQFELAGPMAWRSDVIELDLRGVVGDKVHVRLDCGFQFWEVDQAAMDYTPDSGLVVTEVDAVKAVDQLGHDVLPLIAKDDDVRYVQPHVDDAAVITFPAPPASSALLRSTFLHGAGHYRILHETFPIEPDLLYLRGFKKADALPKYSRERWLEMNGTPVSVAL